MMRCVTLIRCVVWRLFIMLLGNGVGAGQGTGSEKAIAGSILVIYIIILTAMYQRIRDFTCVLLRELRGLNILFLAPPLQASQ